jgi:hypothetical protein
VRAVLYASEGQRARNRGGSAAQGSSHFRCRRLRLADRGARRLICVLRFRGVMDLSQALTDRQTGRKTQDYRNSDGMDMDTGTLQLGITSTIVLCAGPLLPGIAEATGLGDSNNGSLVSPESNMRYVHVMNS